MIAGLDELGATGVLLAVEENRRRVMDGQAELLALAAHWCDLHGGVSFDDQRRVVPGAEVLLGLGGAGTPEVEEFAAAEFGVMRGMHPMAARNLMADALDLRHRFPLLWTAVHQLRVEVWVCRKIASSTRGLSAVAAGYVDAAIADYVGSLPAGRLLGLVEAKVIEADPEAAEEQRRLAEQARFVRTTGDEHGLRVLIARAAAGDVVLFADIVERIAAILVTRGDGDAVNVRRSKAIGILAVPAQALKLLLEAETETETHAEAGAETQPVIGEEPESESESEPARRSLLELLKGIAPEVLRPRVRLFVHLHQDALSGARDRVARVEGLGPMTLGQVRAWLGQTAVDLVPVLDLAGQEPVDGYEFPARIIEAVHQLQPVDAFPWAVNTGRRKDTDHPTAYVPMARGGPPGQTGIHNAARLTRHHHRIKTHTNWTATTVLPGAQLWRSPHGFWFLVDHTGTHRLPEHHATAIRPHHGLDFSPHERNLTLAVIHAT